MSRLQARTSTWYLLTGVLAALLLTGCGGDSDDPAKATGSPTDTTGPAGTPTASSLPTPTATVTGPSGDTPSGRRDSLGGCPAAAAVTALAGTGVTANDDPGPTLICSFTATGTTSYDGQETPEIRLTIAEPVGISGKHTLAGYRRNSERNNPTASVSGLGAGAFANYFESSPELCAVWFLAEDGKILTASAHDVRRASVSAQAGPDSPACAVARKLAGTLVS